MKIKYLIITLLLSTFLLGACSRSTLIPATATIPPTSIPTGVPLATTLPTDIPTAIPSVTVSPVRQITVSGTGQIFLVPDVVYINIGVHSQAEKVRDALNDNNTKTAAVKKALLDLGVAEKDFQTAGFNIYVTAVFDKETGTNSKNEYVVDNMMNIIVRDLSKVGQILDAAVTSGANSIYGIQFDVLDKEKAQSEARKLAVADAQKQAEELAAAVGGELGSAITVSTVVNQYPIYTQYAAKELAVGGGQVPISAGQLVLSMQVTIVYELK
jgi:uncharacterized protein